MNQHLGYQIEYQQVQQQNLSSKTPERLLLPPITTILKDCPSFHLPIFSLYNNKNEISVTKEEQQFNTSVPGNEYKNNNNYYINEKSSIITQETTQTSEKTPQYTLADDLLILKTINSYYGTSFHGRVPWSFWQTFRKVTGNKRSPSSLYHHWNGAMKRKYGSFLNRGKINECISWIETAMESGKPSQKESSDNEFVALPLAHNWSFPPTNLENNTRSNVAVSNI